MDKLTLGLVAALGAAAATPALAEAPATQKITNPASVAELLDPVSNPVETLRALRADQNSKPVRVAEELSIGLGGVHVHHHHYHHHHYHHHHHHHMVVIHRYHHHHHHHHNED
jgi:hypothetical protein